MNIFKQTVVEVANARGFSIIPEYRLNRTKYKGSHKKIDYCLVYNNQKIALEFKVIKDKNQNYNMKNDIIKLNKFLSDEDKQLYLSAYQI